MVCQDSSRSSSTFATRRWIIGAGVVGIASDLTARIDAALYYEMHDVADETINITFIEACEVRKLVSGAGTGVGTWGFGGSGNRDG